jgi:hypothetical protein
MGTETRARQRRSREKNAAQRIANSRTRSRRRILIASGGIGLVAAIGITIALVGPGPSRASTATGRDPSAAREVTSVPADVFNAVGTGTATGLTPTPPPPPPPPPPTPAPTTPTPTTPSGTGGQAVLTSGGKPEVLYMGGEYCPFCAAERWALTAALSRFGTFSGLSFIHSSPSDVYPGTPTLTFYKSRYTSRYVSFVPVEWYGEADDASTPTGHVVLQTPTAAQSATFGRYANNSFPFVDIGDKYTTGVQYDPADLAGMSWSG